MNKTRNQTREQVIQQAVSLQMEAAVLLERYASIRSYQQVPTWKREALALAGQLSSAVNSLQACVDQEWDLLLRLRKKRSQTPSFLRLFLPRRKEKAQRRYVRDLKKLFGQVKRVAAELEERASTLPEDDQQKVEILGKLTDQKKQALHQKRTPSEISNLTIADMSKLIDASGDEANDEVGLRELWRQVWDHVKEEKNTQDPYKLVIKGLEEEIAAIDRQITFLNRIR